MDRPLEIRFHHMEHSAEIEALVRERVDKLEQIFPHIIGCKVSVEENHKQHRTGNVPEVHIEIDVPKDKIVIAREPQKAKKRHAAPDARTSVRDSFAAAERRLLDYKRKLNGEVKPHPEPLAGRVQQMFPDQDYGFIVTAGGSQLYFHRNSITDGTYDDLNVGDTVHYIEADGDTGPTAAKLWHATPIGKKPRR